MKNFIRDENGSVKECQSNIAKMNILEWIWYFGTSFFTEGIEFIWNQFKEGVPLVFAAIVNTLSLLVFLPITLLIAAKIRIKDAKKEVELLKNINNKEKK